MRPFASTLRRAIAATLHGNYDLRNTLVSAHTDFHRVDVRGAQWSSGGNSCVEQQMIR